MRYLLIFLIGFFFIFILAGIFGAKLFYVLMWPIILSFIIMLFIWFFEMLGKDEIKTFVLFPFIGIMLAVLYYLLVLLILFVRYKVFLVPYPWLVLLMGIFLGMIVSIGRNLAIAVNE